MNGYPSTLPVGIGPESATSAVTVSQPPAALNDESSWLARSPERALAHGSSLKGDVALLKPQIEKAGFKPNSNGKSFPIEAEVSEKYEPRRPYGGEA